jgi:hypothetical protein
MADIKIILFDPTVSVAGGVVTCSCRYRLSEPVQRIGDGRVSVVPASNAGQAQILSRIRQAAVDDANEQTGNAVGFGLLDVITWELQA